MEYSFNSLKVIMNSLSVRRIDLTAYESIISPYPKNLMVTFNYF